MARALALLVVSIAVGVAAFTALARNELGPPRPEGTVCDFQHDPGSGKSAEGLVERRGWLVPHEVCVHATDGEYSRALGPAPFAALLGPPFVGVVVFLERATRPRRAGRTPHPGAAAVGPT